MHTPDLLLISTIAFIAVLILLAVLAGAIRLITMLFPAQVARDDAAVLAAVTSVYSNLYPGTHLTNMEEVR